MLGALLGSIQASFASWTTTSPTTARRSSSWIFSTGRLWSGSRKSTARGCRCPRKAPPFSPVVALANDQTSAHLVRSDGAYVYWAADDTSAPLDHVARIRRMPRD